MAKSVASFLSSSPSGIVSPALATSSRIVAVGMEETNFADLISASTFFAYSARCALPFKRISSWRFSIALVGSSRSMKRISSASSTYPESSSSRVIQSCLSMMSLIRLVSIMSCMRMPRLSSSNVTRPEQSLSNSLNSIKNPSAFRLASGMTSSSFWLSKADTAFCSSYSNPPSRLPSIRLRTENCFLSLTSPIPNPPSAVLAIFAKRANSTCTIESESSLSSAHHSTLILLSENSAALTLNKRRMTMRSSSKVISPEWSSSISLKTSSHAMPWWEPGLYSLTHLANCTDMFLSSSSSASATPAAARSARISFVVLSDLKPSRRASFSANSFLISPFFFFLRSSARFSGVSSSSSSVPMKAWNSDISMYPDSSVSMQTHTALSLSSESSAGLILNFLRSPIASSSKVSIPEALRAPKGEIRRARVRTGEGAMMGCNDRVRSLAGGASVGVLCALTRRRSP